MTAIEFCNTKNIDFETLQDALKFKFFDNIKDKNDFLPEEIVNHLASCLNHKYFLDWRKFKKEFYLLSSCFGWLGEFRNKNLLSEVEIIAGLTAIKYYKSLGNLQILSNNFFDHFELDPISFKKIRFELYHAWSADSLLANEKEYFISNRQNYDFFRDAEFMEHFKNLNYFMFLEGVTEIAPSKFIYSVIYLIASKQLPFINHGLLTVLRSNYEEKFKGIDLYHKIMDYEEEIETQYLNNTQNKEYKELNRYISKRLKTFKQIHEEIIDLYLIQINISIPNLAKYLCDQYIENNIKVDGVNIDENKAVEVVGNLIRSFEEKQPIKYNPLEEHYKLLGPQNYELVELKETIKRLNENKKQNDKYNDRFYISDCGDHTNEEIIMRALEDGLGEYFGH